MLFPLKRLIEGRGTPTVIRRDKTVQEALSLMVANDFSQLPVVEEDGTLVGLISENSIVSTYYHIGTKVSLLDIPVDNCIIKPTTISPDQDIFEALDLLKSVYAIVVVESRKPVGILTNYDTTNFFRDISEGLILVEDIEVSLRQYIESVYYTEQKMQAALLRAFNADKKDPTRPALDFSELTFYNTMQFITCKANWEDFKPFFQSREMFYERMDQIRKIRNQLAPFQGRLDPVQRNALFLARDWLAARPKPVSAFADRKQIMVTPPGSQIGHPGEHLEYIESWLKGQTSSDNLILVVFKDLEKLIGEKLPDSAYQHRSWWVNDPINNLHSRVWLRAGWEVEDVDLHTLSVIFRQTDHALMQLFFAEALETLKQARPGVTQATKIFSQNWWSFGAGKSGFSFAWVFTQNRELRVELYIDTGNKQQNKDAFDSLVRQKEEIEAKLGYTLAWDRLDHRRASRISTTIKTWVTDPKELLDQAKEWVVKTTLEFVDIFQPRIRALKQE